MASLKLFVTPVVLVAVLACSALAAVDRCTGPRYNCAGRNPCAESLCVEGQTVYPAQGRKKYVVCSDNGACSVEQCTDRGEVWNQLTQQCVVDGCDRCDEETYNCDDHNPCAPYRCLENEVLYPGVADNKYVQCEGYVCHDRTCDDGSVWDQDEQACVSVAACRTLDQWLAECHEPDFNAYLTGCGLTNDCTFDVSCPKFYSLGECTLQDVEHCSAEEMAPRYQQVLQIHGGTFQTLLDWCPNWCNRCQNDAVCAAFRGDDTGYHCICTEQYSGDNCEIPNQ